MSAGFNISARCAFIDGAGARGQIASAWSIACSKCGAMRLVVGAKQAEARRIFERLEYSKHDGLWFCKEHAPNSLPPEGFNPGPVYSEKALAFAEVIRGSGKMPLAKLRASPELVEAILGLLSEMGWADVSRNVAIFQALVGGEAVKSVAARQQLTPNRVRQIFDKELRKIIYVAVAAKRYEGSSR